MDDPNFQTIGVKGLKQVLEERNVPTAGKVQEELVELLQEFPDFAKRNLITRLMSPRSLRQLGMWHYSV
jgi:hypothetical protein